MATDCNSIFDGDSGLANRPCTAGAKKHEVHVSGTHTWTDKSPYARRRCKHEMLDIDCCDEARDAEDEALLHPPAAPATGKKK